MTYPSVFEMTGLQPVGGANREAIDAAERALGRVFPDDYKAFLRETDGLEGFVGKAYVQMWSVRVTVEMNELMSEDKDYAPGLLRIGGDGGGMGYALPPDGGGYVQFDLIDTDPEPMGDSLIEFFERVQAESLLAEDWAQFHTLMIEARQMVTSRPVPEWNADIPQRDGIDEFDMYLRAGEHIMAWEVLSVIGGEEAATVRFWSTMAKAAARMGWDEREVTARARSRSGEAENR